jgi:hypothetical protein
MWAGGAKWNTLVVNINEGVGEIIEGGLYNGLHLFAQLALDCFNPFAARQFEMVYAEKTQ